MLARGLYSSWYNILVYFISEITGSITIGDLRLSSDERKGEPSSQWTSMRQFRYCGSISHRSGLEVHG